MVPVARVVAAYLVAGRILEIVLVKRIVADKRQVAARVAVFLVAVARRDGPDAVERIAERDVVEVRVVPGVVRRGGVVDLVVAPGRAVGVERLAPVVARRPADVRAPVLPRVLVEVLALELLVVGVAEEDGLRVAPVGPELAGLLDRVGVVDLGIGTEVVLYVGLERLEGVAPLSVPPCTVGLVEIGVSVVAVVRITSSE